jgi:excisionase family DNA binding protein
MKASQPLTVTIDEASRLLGISRNSTYQQVAAGAIPSLRLGRRLVIPKVQLDRLLAGEVQESRKAPSRR